MQRGPGNTVNADAMNLNFTRVLVLASVALASAVAPAGSIKTSDGKEFAGEISLEGEALAVKAADGTTSSVSLAQIEHAVLNEPPPAAPVSIPMPEDKREVIPPGCGLRAEYFDYENRQLKLTRVD